MTSHKRSSMVTSGWESALSKSNFQSTKVIFSRPLTWLTCLRNFWADRAVLYDQAWTEIKHGTIWPPAQPRDSQRQSRSLAYLQLQFSDFWLELDRQQQPLGASETFWEGNWKAFSLISISHGFAEVFIGNKAILVYFSIHFKTSHFKVACPHLMMSWGPCEDFTSVKVFPHQLPSSEFF